MKKIYIAVMVLSSLVDNLYAEPSTGLHDAARKGDIDAVRALLHQGSQINEKNWYGQTPLILSVRAGHYTVARFILEKGADVNACDMERYTPIHWAAQYGYDDIVTCLLEYGADVNTMDNAGNTSLHNAVEDHRIYLYDPPRVTFEWSRPKESTVILLLRYGADPMAQTQEGKKPADLTQNTEIKKLLDDEPERRAKITERASEILLSLKEKGIPFEVAKVAVFSYWPELKIREQAYIARQRCEAAIAPMP